ncbi:MAG: class I SAM-dependent methyltransferase [Candidatus Thiodiazotropha sp.]
MSSKNDSLLEVSSLPSPEVYELEYDFWPWGVLLQRVKDWVVEQAPRQATVLDYMCGTGYLLSKIANSRPDLNCQGCDITFDFVAYANRCYPKLAIINEDALRYRPTNSPKVVLCTAGLHHLPFSQQPLFVKKVARELSNGDRFLLGEELVREHHNEKSRALAALELGSALIAHSLESEAPVNVTEAAFQVLRNDVFLNGEYKHSRSQILTLLEPYFEVERIEQTWPDDIDAFGDFLFVCKRR